jgi:hypothetical protein
MLGSTPGLLRLGQISFLNFGNPSDCDNVFLLVIQEWHMEYGRAKQAILAASPVGGHRKNILIQNVFL